MVRLAVVIALVASACVSTSEGNTTTTATEPATTTTAPDPGAPSSTIVVAPCASLDVPFTDAGPAGSGGVESSDAALVDSIRWETHDGCERLRIAFSTLEGAPAVSPPAMGATFLRHAGVVRIQFGSSIVGSVFAEQLVDTELVGRVFVVTAFDGSLSVDVHLAAPAFVRSSAQTLPASVVLDLIPGGDPYPSPPVVDDGLVLIGPDPETSATYPLTVGGYTEPDGRETIEGRLAGSDGSVVLGQGAIRPSDRTWSGFSIVFPNGPSGPVTVGIEDGPSLRLSIG